MKCLAAAVGIGLIAWTTGMAQGQDGIDLRPAPPSDASSWLSLAPTNPPLPPSAKSAADSPPALSGAPESPIGPPPAPPSPPAPDAAAPPSGPEPWKLPQPCLFQRLGINTGGWVQQGITLNATHPADGFNGPITTNDLDRQYQLNQAWMYFVRPTNTQGCGWDLGGRVDVVYGTDWRFGQNFGLEMEIDSPNHFYGLILPQFYAEVAVNNLTVKMGHYATGTSYELVPAPLNFFYSHTYLMAGYFDPLLVTGMEASYKIGDNLQAVGGFNRGWMMFEDMNDSLNFLGGFRWNSDDKRTALSVSVDTGPQDPAGQKNRTSVITVFSHQFNDKLTYAMQQTAGWEQNGSVVEPGETAQWYGMAHWLFYKINAKWSAGTRFEWIRDDDGARIFGIGNILGTDKGWSGAPGFAGDFYDLTFGLNWRPCPNVVLRPEVRWDWYGGSLNVARQLPFDDGHSSQQFSTAMDLIVTF